MYILKEQSLSTCYSESIWATQKTATQILLETSLSSFLLKTEIQVTNMALNTDYIAVTNSRVIVVYTILYKNTENTQVNKKDTNISTTMISTFTCDNEKILMHGKNVIILTKTGVLVKSPNGLNLATIATVSSEGVPIGMNSTNNYLTVFTMDGYVKLYDLSQREPKLVTPVRSLYDMCEDFGEIIHAKSNSTGTKIALTLATANLIPDGKLYVWDIETDTLLEYNFRNTNSTYDEEEKTQEDEADGKNDNFIDIKVDHDKICMDRIPLSISWDTEDARLLICDAKKLKAGDQNGLGVAQLLRHKKGIVGLLKLMINCVYL